MLCMCVNVWFPSISEINSYINSFSIRTKKKKSFFQLKKSLFFDEVERKIFTRHSKSINLCLIWFFFLVWSKSHFVFYIIIFIFFSHFLLSIATNVINVKFYFISSFFLYFIGLLDSQSAKVVICLMHINYTLQKSCCNYTERKKKLFYSFDQVKS